MTYDRYVPVKNKFFKEFFKPTFVAGRKIIERDWQDRVHIKGRRLIARGDSCTVSAEDLPGFVNELLERYPFSVLQVVYEPIRQLTEEEQVAFDAWKKNEIEKEEKTKRRLEEERQMKLEEEARRRIAVASPPDTSLIGSAILLLERQGYTVTK